MYSQAAGIETYRVSQILSVPSSLPVTSHFASQCHAIAVTLPVCPSNVATCEVHPDRTVTRAIMPTTADQEGVSMKECRTRHGPNASRPVVRLSCSALPRPATNRCFSSSCSALTDTHWIPPSLLHSCSRTRRAAHICRGTPGRDIIQAHMHIGRRGEEALVWADR